MWGILGFAVGAFLGSLVKTLADRSLSEESFGGRSKCPKCHHTLAWYDLIPILSYLFVQGKCRYCHKKINTEYLLVEVVMGTVIGFLFWQILGIVQVFDSEVVQTRGVTGYIFQFLSNLISKIFFITVLSVVFLTDLKRMFIPDRVMIPAIGIGILARALTQQFLWSILTGGLIGGFFLALIAITKGKGMGGGDVKLGAFIGLMLGFPQGILAIVLSFFTGAIFSLFLIFLGKKHFGQGIPFGPFLVLGSLISLFWGEKILNWYLAF